MIARDKQDFVNHWTDHVNQLYHLGDSTDTPQTWEEIKRLTEEAGRLVRQVANEMYGEENE
jgi:hypothetical protein